MSKIQIDQLNLNASEFNTLNKEETAEVVGGYSYYYQPYYSYSSSYYSDNDFAAVHQSNYNATQQVAFGGYYGDTVNNNYTNQNNSANIYQ
ncbi:MAG: hypothetical protein QNJ72_12410 [Pleurocapsa sp. MO_226.B13]|nr:hypothetical protein [Pleurocapsa sp. MO_226.B13]